jgi:hypothetical protein
MVRRRLCPGVRIRFYHIHVQVVRLVPTDGAWSCLSGRFLASPRCSCQLVWLQVCPSDQWFLSLMMVAALVCRFFGSWHDNLLCLLQQDYHDKICPDPVRSEDSGAPSACSSARNRSLGGTVDGKLFFIKKKLTYPCNLHNLRSKKNIVNLSKYAYIYTLKQGPRKFITYRDRINN